MPDFQTIRNKNDKEQNEKVDWTKLNVIDKGFTIFSKSNCKFCVNVKQLLDRFGYKEVNCDEFLLDVEMKEEFLNKIKEKCGKEYRTFPMVFDGLEFIGGFTDTEKYLKNISLKFDELDF